jgi:hypothetical protein
MISKPCSTTNRSTTNPREGFVEDDFEREPRAACDDPSIQKARFHHRKGIQFTFHGRSIRRLKDQGDRYRVGLEIPLPSCTTPKGVRVAPGSLRRRLPTAAERLKQAGAAIEQLCDHWLTIPALTPSRRFRSFIAFNNSGGWDRYAASPYR